MLDAALAEAEEQLARATRDDVGAALAVLGPLLVARELRAKRLPGAAEPSTAHEAARVDVGALALALEPQDRLALAEALVASLSSYETEISLVLDSGAVALLLARGGTPSTHSGLVVVEAEGAAKGHVVKAYTRISDLDEETLAKVAHLFPAPEPPVPSAHASAAATEPATANEAAEELAQAPAASDRPGMS